MPRRRQVSGSGHESEETKHLLLHTARHLFLSEGYHAISTRQITDACGLTHPALYHYFTGKEDLYVSMLLEEIARLHAVLDRLSQRDEQTVLERLRRVTLFLLTTTNYDFTLMQHDIESELALPAQEALGIAFTNGVIEPLAHIFAQGQQQGQIHNFTHEGLNTTGLATLLLTLIAHFLTSRVPGIVVPTRGRSSAVVTTELIMHLLLHGIAAPQKNLWPEQKQPEISDGEADEVS
jgi:AcrR family transcriptional regulator